MKGVDELQDSEERRGKVELAIGNLSFSGEGDQRWLDQQISKIIDLATPAQITTSVDGASSTSEPMQNEPVSIESLASFLRAKGGDTVQVKRFLATAAWLSHRGEKVLTTRAVTKALQDNQQKRLGNAADCLNKSVRRGLCEKTNEGFIITPEGWEELG